jgi:hypothetical protein
MTRGRDQIPVWMIVNAWREIFTRIFEDVETKLNISPEWLVNPATNRRLKLDLLYPDLGIAVRFEGLQGKQGQRRPSLEEEAQQRTRDLAREELCRAHGINLIAVDTSANAPMDIFKTIDLMLSRAGGQAPEAAIKQKIRQSRATAAALARRIDQAGDLKLYAELWEDRQYQIPEPAQTPAPSKGAISFSVGMEVEHNTFGPGMVLAVIPSGADTLLTVDFVTAGQKTLAASLVADKLYPR